jgi:two-component system sensor histidine kinase HydH
MHLLPYIRLIGFTAGTLLPLFWMVVILGHRRQRNFERVLFFLCLALLAFYGGSLLALNAQIHYAEPPAALLAFAVTLLSAGLCLLPSLLIHLHAEYAGTQGVPLQLTKKRLRLFLTYLPALYFAAQAYPRLTAGYGFGFLEPGNGLGRAYSFWLGASLMFCTGLELRLAEAAGFPPVRAFHRFLAGLLGVGGALVFSLHVFNWPANQALAGALNTALLLLPILPLAVLIYLVQRYNFLEIGRQKNLLYAVSATFLALLYLSLVRRVSGWLEPILPPEATAAVLLFVLVIFVEPLQRVLGGRLRDTLHQEVDRLQRLTAEIQQEARQGDLAALIRFIEQRVKEAFEVESVRLELTGSSHGAGFAAEQAPEAPERAVLPFAQREFAIRQGEEVLGYLHAQPHGASLSGETRAALEFLCEQLPGALDLCRLIEEKLRLERELAERERLALVGQMAASISHNLKNPLGSIKTILQVQLESPELPEKLRGETRLVLEEVGRLSAKLSQLLQFSRPAVRGQRLAANCDARSVGEEVASVLRHEAEGRGIALETSFPAGPLEVTASRDALSDVLSNLLVNALEAAPKGGHVALRLAAENGHAVLSVEDDGPGIPAALRSRVLQPFFTTKAQGTGLGLAIVSRRVAESGGRLEWESPAANGRGTRFRVTLPLAQ